LGMAWRAERHQAVEIEVRARLSALDDVVDLEGAPAGRRPRSASGRAERPPGFRLCMWLPRGLTRVKSALRRMFGGGLLAHPIPVYLGRISFGLYIFHQAVAQGVLLHVDVPWPLRLGLTLALTLCLAALSYVLLERPFLRLKMRFTYVRSAPV
jgi:peptidoglycan/LPS O-acetylase OafA/YrhL